MSLPTRCSISFRRGLRWPSRTPLLACALTATALAAGLPTPSSSYRGPPAGLAADIRAQASLLEGVGLSVAVSRGDKVEWAAGFGSVDLATKQPAMAGTVFQVGSITKTFTAALVMQLVQEGRLSLDEHIGHFVPGLPWGQRVTIAELLNHTSGIVDYVNAKPSMLGANCPAPSGSTAGCPALTPGQVVSWLARHRLMFSPGTEFSYSNSNYYLLGLVIQRVTGQSYDTYLERRIIAPLGLAQTGPCPDQMTSHADAVGYLLGATPVPLTGLYAFGSEAFAAGELCSTAGDLVEWVNDLASGRVVSAKTYKEMSAQTHIPGQPDAPYGYGLVVSSVGGQPFVGHTGATFGFLSSLYHFTNLDLNVAICTDAYPNSPSTAPLVADAIQNIVTEIMPST